ncbi:hypothetical protein Sjap_020632 [Stephania japonica]|uniref:Uncharacterized protein n=1 Tax=Stephania japonica TaxID=461633 RepID=A0AAP0HVR2_9MAGN
MGGGANRNIPGFDDEDEYYCWNCGDNNDHCKELCQWKDECPKCKGGFLYRKCLIIRGGLKSKYKRGYHFCSNDDCDIIE